MKHVMAVARKEWKRFFAHPVYASIAIFLPGLFLLATYTLMGNAFPNEEAQFTISVANTPPSLIKIDLDKQITLKEATIEENDVDAMKNALDAEEYNLFLFFPDDFDSHVAHYDSTTGEEAPAIHAYYDSSNNMSLSAYMAITQYLDKYEQGFTNKFDINPDSDITYDLSPHEEMDDTFMAGMIPFLVVIILFTSITAIASESLAGEKERGTIAALLATPVSRHAIAFGKIIALSTISLLSALVSTISIIVSMKYSFGKVMSMPEYHVSDYVWLTLIILSLTVMLVMLVTVLSGVAKTTKDAQTSITPLMVVVMGATLFSFISSTPKTSLGWFLIPIFNSSEAMKSIFMSEPAITAIVLSIVVNLLVTALGVVAIAKMLSSERLMFQR